MNVIGIVCEYNPMHLGHLYQIQEIKKRYPDSILVIVTCGCFTQRGDICIINKWDKTKVALEQGIDLVIELPFVYSTQSADIFAKGAIQLLHYLKVDTIVFGSESNDLTKLRKIVEVQLFDHDYQQDVKRHLATGVNYPTAMSLALKEHLGYTVQEPNDILGIAYMKEILRNKYNINIVSIKRTNSYHSKNIGDNNIVNASLIREMLSKNQDVEHYIVDNSYTYLYCNVSIQNAFDYLKYQIMNQDISKFQTVDEGIHYKIKKEIIYSNSYEDLLLKLKSKRYTYNKISRMLLHILTNFTKEEAHDISIDYIRLLGFSTKGQKYLNSIKKDISIPIITHYKKKISKVLDIEFRTTCIYSLIVHDPKIITYEFQHKPIIKKD